MRARSHLAEERSLFQGLQTFHREDLLRLQRPEPSIPGNSPLAMIRISEELELSRKWEREFSKSEAPAATAMERPSMRERLRSRQARFPLRALWFSADERSISAARART